MLSQAELDSMRETLLASLPDEAAIYRPDYESDGQGGRRHKTGSPALIATYPARLSPVTGISSVERVIAERLASEHGHILTLPVGADVELADLAEVLFLETLERKTVEVVSVIDPRTYNLATRVAVIEVNRP